jgi:hypothetical protein
LIPALEVESTFGPRSKPVESYKTMSSSRLGFAALTLVAAAFGAGPGLAQDQRIARGNVPLSWPVGAPIPEAQVEQLHKFICPQPTESKWARLPWMWNLMEARKKAVESDKPLLFWRAGGGDVLGRA